MTGAATIRAFRSQDRFIEENKNKIDANVRCAFIFDDYLQSANDTAGIWERCEVIFNHTSYGIVFRTFLTAGNSAGNDNRSI